MGPDALQPEALALAETKAEITLSGSNTGSCYVSGACFGTGSPDGTYSNNEACTFTFSDDAGFAVGRFNTESGYDHYGTKHFCKSFARTLLKARLT